MARGTRFSWKFLGWHYIFFAFFSCLLDWIMLILVGFERSLHPAQVRWQDCPLPLKLMNSQAVELRDIDLHGRFRGVWVAAYALIPWLKKKWFSPNTQVHYLDKHPVLRKRCHTTFVKLNSTIFRFDLTIWYFKKSTSKKWNDYYMNFRYLMNCRMKNKCKEDHHS